MAILTYKDPTPRSRDRRPLAREATATDPRAFRVVAVAGGTAFGGYVAHLLLHGDGGVATATRIATGSAGTVIAALGAFLFLRRMQRTRTMADAVLAATLTVLAGASALGAVMPDADATVRAVLTAGAGIALAVGLGVAARTAGDELHLAARTDRVFSTAVVAGGVLLGGGVALLALLRHTGAHDQALWLVAALNFVAAIAALFAATALTRARALGGDPVRMWLAAAAAILAVADLGDTLLWGSGNVLGGGDLVQVAGWVALLVGGFRDLEWAQRQDAEKAVLAERRRLARELHDGLAQELAYISTETRRLVGHPSAGHLAKAAERALEESRTAILALGRPADEPIERTLSEIAHSLAARAGVDAVVAVRPGLEVAPDTRQALIRILREAVSNAVRHGRAERVRVSLDGPSPLVLAVADDGDGFDPGAVCRPDALGLMSMRERAENLGGTLTIESAPGRGATVAVVIP